jgi:hypothetical protein
MIFLVKNGFGPDRAMSIYLIYIYPIESLLPGLYQFELSVGEDTKRIKKPFLK